MPAILRYFLVPPNKCWDGIVKDAMALPYTSFPFH
jgi:hypothetical protein